MDRIAYFVSSHGYGHAARACAVMQSYLKVQPKTHFFIFSQVPKWFFEDSLPQNAFTYFNEFTDVGLIQKSPFEEDLKATLSALESHFPIAQEKIEKLTTLLNQLNVTTVLNDISIVGIEIGKHLQLRTMLIENFTWDWIYYHYVKSYPRLQFFIDYFSSVYQQVDVHIQTQPFVKEERSAFQVAPIARRARQTASETRSQLGVKDHKPLVLISTGGIVTRHEFVEQLKSFEAFNFIVPHDVAETTQDKNVIALPHHSNFYHPDLVNASDVVVCKAGYSTVAEIYLHQKPVILIKRPSFAESAILENFASKNLATQIIDPATFRSGKWLSLLPEAVVKRHALNNKIPNGADVAVEIIRSF